MKKLNLICLCFLSGLAQSASTMMPLNKTECVEWHNIYRAIHQAPKVNWSKTLADEAQAYAEKLAKENIFKHGSTGENLFQTTKDSKNACEIGIKAFYKEEKFYNYDKPGFSNKDGHFTQVVWIGSKEIGVGKAMTKDGKIILVYRYRPAGNYKTSFAKNVKPPIGDALSLSYHASLVHYICVFGLISMAVY